MKNNFNVLCIFWVLFLTFPVISSGQNKSNSSSQGTQITTDRIPHLEKQGNATQLVVNGKPFLLIAGELHNSTTGGFEYMRPVWKKLAKKNLNSVLAPVTWELIEPEEGKFNFAQVDSIIWGARKANLKVVLLWFGSWKNGTLTYTPSWIKENYKKYLLVENEDGKPLQILSTFGEASLKADVKAFAALMRHIKEVDGKHQTVVMMQVENEIGVFDFFEKNPGDTRRDFSPAANAAYNNTVPEKLMDHLVKHKDNLFPELFKVWGQNGFKTSGTWEEIFGKSEFRPEKENWQSFYSYYTEGLFSAWNYASYVEKVVEAGKKEYPLPMYVNACLRQPYNYWPGKFPSGGPLPEVLDVWRANAPSVDFIAPDIYIDEFTWVCEEFTRNGNPLFIPEARGGEVGAAQAFFALGQFDAMGFSPFAIDNIKYAEKDPLDESYEILQQMSPLILANQGLGTMKGLLVSTASPVQHFELGDYSIEVRLAGQDKPNLAGGLIIQTGQQEFITAGKALEIFIVPKNDSCCIGINTVDEGTFKDGKWLSERRLNGDETYSYSSDIWNGNAIKLSGNKVSIQKISLYRYK